MVDARGAPGHGLIPLVSARHTNPSPTLGVTLAYRGPRISRFLTFTSQKKERPPPGPLRSVPSLRSAPGRFLNKITFRPTLHFHPPLDFTSPCNVRWSLKIVSVV